MVRRQMHDELGHEAAVPADSFGGGPVDPLGADRQLPPVPERGMRAGDRRSLDLQVRHGAAVHVAARARVAGACRRPCSHTVGGDLAGEERDPGGVALGLRRGVGLDARRRRRGRRLRRDDRSVGGVGEDAARGRGRVGR